MVVFIVVIVIFEMNMVFIMFYLEVFVFRESFFYQFIFWVQSDDEVTIFKLFYLDLLRCFLFFFS